MAVVVAGRVIRRAAKAECGGLWTRGKFPARDNTDLKIGLFLEVKAVKSELVVRHGADSVRTGPSSELIRPRPL